MKGFFKRNWKTIATALILFLLGMLATRVLIPPKTIHIKDYDFDSLNKQKEVYQIQTKHYQDSVVAVIQDKDKALMYLSKQLKEVRRIHTIEIASIPPAKDTSVNEREYVRGQQCIEEIPLLESQITTCYSEIEDYKNLVIEKQKYNMFLENKFNECIVAGKSEAKKHEQELKKAERRRKANKAWAVITTAGTGMAIIGMFVV